MDLDPYLRQTKDSASAAVSPIDELKLSCEKGQKECSPVTS